VQIISSFTKEKVSKIVKTWVKQNDEAILCQRILTNKIAFSPIKMESFNSNILSFFIKIESGTLNSLKKSKFFYKTVSVLTHRSSRSNPSENKGILFIGRILEWMNISPRDNPSMLNQSVWMKGDELFLVKIELFKTSFWSGISFGSYHWKKVPNNLFKGFNRKNLFPHWKNGKRVSLEEMNIYNSSQFLIVAVITKQGTIHVTPVDFTAIKNRIIFATSFSSTKFKAFKISNIMAAFTYQTKGDFANYSKSLTFHGSTFIYGWNIITSFFYLFLFIPYLVFVIIWFYRKYPQSFRRFPFRSTNYRWHFMPIVGRTFFEILWKDD
jgi:hypothetical protein